ncbi:MAG: phage integrase N-terminal SAM-like domain-containing protein, partial [Pseudomonadota bacterium]
MTREKMSLLRTRMIGDMRIKGLGEGSRKAHIQAVRCFSEFIGRSPETATAEDVRAYQLHLVDMNVTPPTYNVRLVGLRFFFETMCPRPEMKRHMRYQRAAKKIPVVLSAEEVARILEAAPGPGLRSF